MSIPPIHPFWRRVLVAATMMPVLAASLAACRPHPTSPAPTTSPSPPLLQTATPTGHITWDFSGVSAETRPLVEEVAASSLQFYRQHVGAPWHDMRVRFKFDKEQSYNGRFDTSSANCRQANPLTAIVLRDQQPAAIRKTLPHEVAHALMGCAAQAGRFSEMHAEALSQLYFLSTELSDQVGLNLAEYRQANRPGIGVTSGWFQEFSGLAWYRYEMLGSALRLYEKVHTGFLKRHYLAMYQEVRRLEQLHGTISFPEQPDFLALGRRIEPAFRVWAARQHILDDPPAENRILSLAYQNRLQFVAIRFVDSNQEPWAGLPLSVRLANAPVAYGFDCVTNKQGLCPDTYGMFKLKTIKELYPHLRTAVVVVKGGGLTDRYTYPIL